MRLLNFIFLFGLLIINTSCNAFEEKELYGSWQDESLYLKFNEDHTLELKKDDGDLIKGRYLILGNTLELVDDEGEVFFVPRVIKIEGDSLHISIKTPTNDTVRVLGRIK